MPIPVVVFAGLAIGLGVLGFVATLLALRERRHATLELSGSETPEARYWADALRERHRRLVGQSRLAITLVLAARVIVSLVLVGAGALVLAGSIDAVRWLSVGYRLLPAVALAAVAYDLWFRLSRVVPLWRKAEPTPELQQRNQRVVRAAIVSLAVVAVWLLFQLAVSGLAIWHLR